MIFRDNFGRLVVWFRKPLDREMTRNPRKFFAPFVLFRIIRDPNTAAAIRIKE